jgi:hypothetical protein
MRVRKSTPTRVWQFDCTVKFERKELSLHVHGMQNNAALELNAVYAAQKAEAKQRAEQTRKKLFEFASALECDAEDYIVTLGEGLQDRSGQQDRNHHQNGSENSGSNEALAEPRISDGLDFLA